MTKEPPYERAGTAKTGLTNIAAWQFAAFLFLLLLIWANEIHDFSHLVYSRKRTPPDFFRAAILSACVFATAVVTVGHTFVLQARMLSGFIVVCSFCHKVKIKPELWQTLEKYISEHAKVVFSHGLCPECYDEQMTALSKGGSEEGLKASVGPVGQ